MALVITFVDVAVGFVLVLSWLVSRKAATNDTSPSAALPRRYMQTLCQLVLVSIALVPLVLLNKRAGAVDYIAVGDSGNVRGKVENPQLTTQTRCADVNGAVLTLTLRSVDFAHDAVNGDLMLCVGDQVLRKLMVSATRARPVTEGLTAPRASKSYLQSAFDVIYQGWTPAMSWTRAVTINSILGQTPTSYYGNQWREPIDLGMITIPCLGSAADYPFDTYYADGSWTFAPPAGMVFNSGATQPGFTLSLVIAATPDAGNIVWHSAPRPELGDVIAILGSRAPSMQIFVCLIAILPLLLFVGLLASIWPIANDPERERFPAELLVGLGAFLLAIIPIRALLVPGDIMQLTVVDYTVGTEMVVMVVASLMIVSARSINSRSKR